MKLSRLSGLFLLSLFLAACWLSTLPGAEDPWDENKIVVSDSGLALESGGLITDDEDNDGGVITIIFPGIRCISGIFDLQIVVLRNSGSEKVKRNAAQRSSIVEVREPETVLPRGELSKLER
jgi:hypothetical protein